MVQLEVFWQILLCLMCPAMLGNVFPLPAPWCGWKVHSLEFVNKVRAIVLSAFVVLHHQRMYLKWLCMRSLCCLRQRQCLSEEFGSLSSCKPKVFKELAYPQLGLLTSSSAIPPTRLSHTDSMLLPVGRTHKVSDHRRARSSFITINNRRLNFITSSWNCLRCSEAFHW